MEKTFRKLEVFELEIKGNISERISDLLQSTDWENVNAIKLKEKLSEIQQYASEFEQHIDEELDYYCEYCDLRFNGYDSFEMCDGCEQNYCPECIGAFSALQQSCRDPTDVDGFKKCLSCVICDSCKEIYDRGDANLCNETNEIICDDCLPE